MYPRGPKEGGRLVGREGSQSTEGAGSCGDREELWVSEDGKAWRAVTLPEAHTVNIDALGVRGPAVHVIGRPGFGQGEDEQAVHWRLAGNGWTRLPAPPGREAVLGEPGGLALIQSDYPTEGSLGRIRLFRSRDGHDFRLSRATSPTPGLGVSSSGAAAGGSAVLVVGDRLLVYARSDGGNLLFESRADDG